MLRDDRLSFLSDCDGVREDNEMPEFGRPEAPIVKGALGGVRGGSWVDCEGGSEGGDMLPAIELRLRPPEPPIRGVVVSAMSFRVVNRAWWLLLVVSSYNLEVKVMRLGGEDSSEVD